MRKRPSRPQAPRLTLTLTLTLTPTLTPTLTLTAGTTALLRRFAIEKGLAGGAWLVVDRARTVRLGTSRCTAEFECAAADVEGKAPDILASAPPDEAWARLPRLSTLAVQVVTNPNPNPDPGPDH